MSVVREVLAELWSMFVGDRRLTVLLLCVVAAVAVLAAFFRAHAYIAAFLLLVGALAVLADSVMHAARTRPGGR
jgi:hypothetical protein